MREGQLKELPNRIEVCLLSDDVPFKRCRTDRYQHLIALDEGEETPVLLLPWLG